MNLHGLNSKPIFNSFEKAIEFLKSEKDVYIALKNVETKLDANIALAEGTKKQLATQIGTPPTDVRKYWKYDYDAFGLEEAEEYFAYDTSDEKENSVCSNGCSLTNVNVKVGIKTPAVNELKSKYNDLCYQINRIKERKNKITRLLANLSVTGTRKIKLSESELTQYGF